MSIVIITTIVILIIVWIICGFSFFSAPSGSFGRGDPIYVGIVATTIISAFGFVFLAISIPVDTQKEQKHSFDKIHTTSSTFIDTGDHYLRSNNLDLRNCEIEVFIVKSLDSYNRIIDEELDYKIKECK